MTDLNRNSKLLALSEELRRPAYIRKPYYKPNEKRTHLLSVRITERAAANIQRIVETTPKYKVQADFLEDCINRYAHGVKPNTIEGITYSHRDDMAKKEKLIYVYWNFNFLKTRLSKVKQLLNLW